MKNATSHIIEALLWAMLVAMIFEVWSEQSTLQGICEEVRQDQGVWLPFEPGFVRVLEYQYFRCEEVVVQIDY